MTQETLNRTVAQLAREVREQEASAAELRAQAKKLGEQAREKETAAAEQRTRLRVALDALGVSECRVSRFKVTLKQGPPRVSFTRAGDPLVWLPERFIRTKKEVNAALINQLLKAGEAVDGAELVSEAFVMVEETGEED